MKRKYGSYIQWDDEQIRFFLEGDKKEVLLPHSEIQAIRVGLTDVAIKYVSGKKVIKMDRLEYSRIKRIKENFERLKLRLDGLKQSKN